MGGGQYVKKGNEVANVEGGVAAGAVVVVSASVWGDEGGGKGRGSYRG